jgi:hypothetical protein
VSDSKRRKKKIVLFLADGNEVSPRRGRDFTQSYVARLLAMATAAAMCVNSSRSCRE